MMRWKYGFFALLLNLVLCFVHPFQALADQWILGEVYMEDDYQEDYLEDYSVASGSDATGSNADHGIMLLSSHEPYDSGSISTSVVTYMTDVVPKFGPVHYVLFRAGQYSYRLYYSSELEMSDSGLFSAPETDFVEYDTRYYTWAYGSESNFSLDPGTYMVYSDLGGYPLLAGESQPVWILVYMGAVYFLYILVRAILSPPRVKRF